MLPPAAPSAPDQRRRPLLAVLVATFFVRLGFGLTLAVFASYILGRSTGLTGSNVGAAGLISAMAPVGEFSTVLLSGALADRYGRWPVLFSGMAAAAVLFAVAATTRDRYTLGAINLVFGVASGAILAASLAVVGDRADEAPRGYEMGRFDAMNLFGWVGGFALGFGLLGALPNDRLDLVFAGGAVALAGGLGVTAWLLRGAPTYHGTPSVLLPERDPERLPSERPPRHAPLARHLHADRDRPRLSRHGRGRDRDLHRRRSRSSLEGEERSWWSPSRTTAGSRTGSAATDCSPWGRPGSWARWGPRPSCSPTGSRTRSWARWD